MNPDFFAQVFGAVADNAGRGAQATGQVADWLIGAGVSVASATAILNGVATSAAATPDQIAYVQNELRYLQQPAQGVIVQQGSGGGLFGLLLIGGLIWLASRD